MTFHGVGMDFFWNCTLLTLCLMKRHDVAYNFFFFRVVVLEETSGKINHHFFVFTGYDYVREAELNKGC